MPRLGPFYQIFSGGGSLPCKQDWDRDSLPQKSLTVTCGRAQYQVELVGLRIYSDGTDFDTTLVSEWTARYGVP